jgi:subtilisin
MAQDKEERSGAGGRRGVEDEARRVAPAAGRAAARDVGNGGDAALASSPPARRRGRYVIGVRAAAGPAAPGQSSLDALAEYLGRQDNVQVVRRVKLGGAPALAGARVAGELLVARMSEDKAQHLRASAPGLLIEPDVELRCAECMPQPLAALGTLLPLRGRVTELTLRVLGEGDQPLAGASVVIDGAGLPAQALSDESGTARLNFFGGAVDAVRLLLVRAPANHWDRCIAAPRLGTGVNTVRLRPLAELYPHFPAERLTGWGQRLMGLDPAAGRFTGDRVRVGLIDSGCDTSHPQLRHITHGRDFSSESTADEAWTEDPMAHGTHCAGIISAAGSSDQGIIGCAPQAELHVLKVLPDGHLSDLLAAVDECIERELDLINLSVVCEGYSVLLAQKLAEAAARGIACIAAAGNTGGPLAVPAALPGVFAVAAVGKLREFPNDSSHALGVIPQLIGRDEVFPASFSAAGPQVAVCAPGIAIVSTVPGGGYAAADGTSAATAHVSAFAALLLAHHPLFQESAFAARSPRRVAALFELLRASAVPRFAEPQRGGAGIPDLRRVPAGQSVAAFAAAAEGMDRVMGYGHGPSAAWLGGQVPAGYY